MCAFCCARLFSTHSSTLFHWLFVLMFPLFAFTHHAYLRSSNTWASPAPTAAFAFRCVFPAISDRVPLHLHLHHLWYNGRCPGGGSDGLDVVCCFAPTS